LSAASVARTSDRAKNLRVRADSRAAGVTDRSRSRIAITIRPLLRNAFPISPRSNRFHGIGGVGCDAEIECLVQGAIACLP
jgi:hypothetical protein